MLSQITNVTTRDTFTNCLLLGLLWIQENWESGRFSGIQGDTHTFRCLVVKPLYHYSKENWNDSLFLESGRVRLQFLRRIRTRKRWK